ncbi:hypothetical protein CEB3_c29850 [Peptococcaceae bacterium CEB3]|nr:hypothetical protein CEB3_c29850 [Peptococcaceae bacterium CEB3]
MVGTDGTRLGMTGGLECSVNERCMKKTPSLRTGFWHLFTLYRRQTSRKRSNHKNWEIALGSRLITGHLLSDWALWLYHFYEHSPVCLTPTSSPYP